MASDMKLYSNSSGINNVVDPTQITFAKGVVGLESAVNVEIDRSGRIVSRKGKTLLVDGSFHSLFEVDGGFLAIQDRADDSALMFVFMQESQPPVVFGVRSGLTKGSKTSYASLGDIVLYTNGHENGQVKQIR